VAGHLSARSRAVAGRRIAADRRVVDDRREGDREGRDTCEGAPTPHGAAMLAPLVRTVNHDLCGCAAKRTPVHCTA
jgi:hypothetical protein